MLPAADGPLPHRVLTAAVDRFPSPKGAATHLAAFSDALFGDYGGGLLVCGGGGGLPGRQLVEHPAGPVEVRRFDPEGVGHVLDRGVAFGALVARCAERHAATLEACHVRDVWGALAALRPDRPWRVVYEVNGLASIELAETHPGAARGALARLDELERQALAAADAVLTPSTTTAAALVARGADPATLTVVPNGADPLDLAAPPPRPPDAPAGEYLVYVGGLQPWQGVDVAVRALAHLADLDVALVVVTGATRRARRPLERLAERVEVAHRVHWRLDRDRAEVQAWLHHAALALAPLRDTPRNTEQGCSPLKVLEAMAAGTAVVASDLPVVRELLDPATEGRLVNPDRPPELARAVRVLLDHPELRARLAAAAHARITRTATWPHATAALLAVHRTALASPPRAGA